MKCKELMHRDLQWVASDATVHDAAMMMRDRSMGFLLVMGSPEGRLAGVVTDRDIAVRAGTRDKRPTEIPVIDIASTDVAVCFEDDPLGEADAMMGELQKSRLVVVTEDRQPVGILSLTDILLHDRRGRALKTARAVLEREAEGAHFPVEQIKITPSAPGDEEAAAQHGTITIGARRGGSMKEFPT